MKKHTFTKKWFAVLSAVIMIISAVFPIYAAAVSVDSSLLGSDTYLTSKTDYNIASGITESQFVTNNGSSSNQVRCYAIEVDLNNPYTSVVAGYKNYSTSSWGRQKVRDQASALEKARGLDVVGGINADFYNMATGEPSGVLVMDGKISCNHTEYPYFAVLNDGSAVIMPAKTPLENVKEAVGGNVIMVKNGEITSSVVGNYTDLQPRTAVGIKADGSVVFFVADGRQSPESCGMNYEQVARTMIALGCIDVLSFDGGGSSTLVSQHEGSGELLCRNSPSSSNERTVASSLFVCSTAQPSGVFDHAVIFPEEKTVGQHSSLTLDVVGVDTNGVATDLPENGRLVLSDESYGTISGTKFMSAGKQGKVTVQYVVDEEVFATGEITVTTMQDGLTEFFNRIMQFFRNIITNINYFMGLLF